MRSVEFVSVALVLSFAPAGADVNCTALRTNGRDELFLSSSAGGQAESLSEEELSRPLGLSQEELKACFGLDADILDDPRRVEGDILPGRLGEGGHLKSALSASALRWPGGSVPYVLSPQYGPISRRVFAEAIRQIQDGSCIRFRAKTTADTSYVDMFPDFGQGCYSLVGRVGGRQPLSIDRGCVTSGTIVHELLHSLGFFHEQSRPDRDEYVRILYENLLPGPDVAYQFRKYSSNRVAQMGVGYDYGSVMHYNTKAFVRSRSLVSIVGLKQGSELMGQRDRISAKDLQKLNKLYSCPGSGSPAAPPPSPSCVDGNASFCGVAKSSPAFCSFLGRYCRKSCKNCA